MKIRQSIDYLDILIYRQRTNSICIDDEAKLIDEDVFYVHLKRILDIHFKKLYSNRNHTLMSSEDESIFLKIENSKTSLQLKSIFFIKYEFNDLIKIFDLLNEQFKESYSMTRLDYCIDFKSPETILNLKKNIDFKKDCLEIHYHNKKKLETVLYKKSNYSIILYNKELESNQKKKNNYLTLYKEKHEDIENLKRFEVKIRSSKNLIDVVKMAQNNTFTEENINNFTLNFVNKRASFTKIIKKILKN